MIYSGPKSPKALIVGDFPNHEETTPGSRNYGGIFTNKAGNELRRALDQSGIFSFNCGYTYAFQTNPEKGNPVAFCGKKAEVGGKDYDYPALSQGKYFHLEHIKRAMDNINQVLAEHRPQIVIATGTIACWLMLGSAKINSYRGSIFTDTKFGIPVIATYSFNQIQRDWKLRPIALFDFIKAKRFLSGEYSQPHRRLLIEPTMEELNDWVDNQIWRKRDTITELSFDIETAKGQITCIGLAPSGAEAICIPFFDPDATVQGKNYWPNAKQELAVYKLVKRVLESPIPKLAQNGMYDIQYLRRYGISPRNFTHDTMVRHHSLYPEMRKDLGFLATIYTDEAPWKMLRNRSRDQLKQED